MRLGCGSSPLTRGKRDRPLGRADGGGLIPAHAGKTARRGGPITSGPAHPRSRGENRTANPKTPCGGGSSPLTRGKQVFAGHHASLVGLIPAHAGKTLGGCGHDHVDGAHPRSRGENDLPGADRALGRGSSPLTRGKPSRIAAMSCATGLIPAHAGKTCSASMTRSSVGAHPRSRGENHRRSAPNGIKSGSSPLTRGKLGSP